VVRRRLEPNCALQHLDGTGSRVDLHLEPDRKRVLGIEVVACKTVVKRTVSGSEGVNVHTFPPHDIPNIAPVKAGMPRGLIFWSMMRSSGRVRFLFEASQFVHLLGDGQVSTTLPPPMHFPWPSAPSEHEAGDDLEVAGQLDLGQVPIDAVGLLAHFC
jgi:hypothetical protein